MAVTLKETYRSKFSLLIEVSGTPSEVESWWLNYEKYYPSGGYGTYKKELSKSEDNLKILVSRSTSCD